MPKDSVKRLCDLTNRALSLIVGIITISLFKTSLLNDKFHFEKFMFIFLRLSAFIASIMFVWGGEI